MVETKEFTLWFLNNLPGFFMSQPLASFLGFAFIAVIIKLIRQIIHL